MASPGRTDRLTITSEALRDNPLGDPHERPVWVQLPPGYDESGDRRYPCVYVIQGYTGQIGMWDNRQAWRPTFPEAVATVQADPDLAPAIVVWVDAWTRFGGSQFVDSPGTGNYHTYLCEEVVSFVDARYRTAPQPAHRGIMGKSSGGFGAMITPMLRPDLFGGLATHAGDSLYEYCYIPEFAHCVRALRDHYDGSWERFLTNFYEERPPMSRSDDIALILTYGCAACFTADDDGTVRLPFDVTTGTLIDDLWERWLAWDPVRMVPHYAQALRGLKAIWIDAGTSDEWFLDLGAQAFQAALRDIGVTDVAFELFDAKHGGIDYRYPLSLRYLTQRLAV